MWIPRKEFSNLRPILIIINYPNLSSGKPWANLTWNYSIITKQLAHLNLNFMRSSSAVVVLMNVIL